MNDSFVKCSVTRGRAPPPPEAYVIKYAGGGAVELYDRSFTRYYFELGSIKKKKRFI